MARAALGALAAVSLVGAALAGVPACSSSSSDAGLCAAMGHCPGNMPRSQSMIDDCNALLGDATCGAKYQTAIQCLSEHEQCDAAGNDDATATLQACAGPYADWMACSTPTEGGAGGG